jgi:PAS domain S-box-containing protein
MKKDNPAVPERLESIFERIKYIADILNASYDGIWITEKSGIVLFINKAAEMLNPLINAKEMIGMNVEELFQRGLISKSLVSEVLRTKKRVTKIHETVDGKRLLITGSPVLDKQEEVSFYVSNMRDITELDKLRDELDQTRALNKYLANMNKIAQNNPEPFSELVHSAAMSKVYETALKAADVDSTILILGESGVGKGFLAKYIHLNSQRKKGPFIRVNCAAIPEPLMESELFGYEAGAFTGARAAGKPGHLEKAEGGTLFLDELGDLPLNTQVKLLRFLEDTEIVPVGGTSFRKVDTRIVAATHRNLEEMTGKGLFREDLFFRVNVISIQIPPLRDRAEDIPFFIHYFLKYFCNKYKRERFIRPNAMGYICDYSYPGNIRELANLVEQLVVLTSKKEIDIEDLPNKIIGGFLKVPTMARNKNLSLKQAVMELEKRLITQALTVYGSQRQAAKALGIDQATVIRKMKRSGLRAEQKIHDDA